MGVTILEHQTFQREIELAGSSFQAFFKHQMQLLVHVPPFQYVQPNSPRIHIYSSSSFRIVSKMYDSEFYGSKKVKLVFP